MPIEQRVVAPGKIGAGKIGAKSAAPPPEPEAEKKGKGGRKKPLILVVALVVLLGAAAAVYFLVLAPQDGEAPEDPGPPPVVEVVHFEPRSLNLASGHYLRLGFALELGKHLPGGGHGGGGGGLDSAAALDAAILVFSGRTVAEVNDPEVREALRAELLARCQAIFGEDLVIGVKFTDYVTQ
ncbi:MAG: flagellar basal body-associated FliL family protein [Micrococcales bacterium]|nr:flagellar basal body-associated FliL family protein [Micrococcales bacterium]